MRGVISQRLWIGNAGDARRVPDVLRTGIKAVVDPVRGASPEEMLCALAKDVPHDVSPGLWAEVQSAIRA
jgi:hypothetical protein